MIEGVIVSPRRVIPDARGDVLHMIKVSDSEFTRFGEMYFSKISIGHTKTWRRHREATSQLAVPIGSVRFVLFDDRSGSSTCGERMDIVIGELSYHLLTIPPLVWYAFQNAGGETALIGNCSSMTRDPTESDRREIDDVRMPQL
jgi:dTDP-4-dehydrorhamnose 3,5-epimerase